MTFFVAILAALLGVGAGCWATTNFMFEYQRKRLEYLTGQMKAEQRVLDSKQQALIDLQLRWDASRQLAQQSQPVGPTVVNVYQALPATYAPQLPVLNGHVIPELPAGWS